MKAVFLEKGLSALYKTRGLGKCLPGVWTWEGHMPTLPERNSPHQVTRRYLGWGLFCHTTRPVSFSVNCQLPVKQAGVAASSFRVGSLLVWTHHPRGERISINWVIHLTYDEVWFCLQILKAFRKTTQIGVLIREDGWEGLTMPSVTLLDRLRHRPGQPTAWLPGPLVSTPAQFESPVQVLTSFCQLRHSSIFWL